MALFNVFEDLSTVCIERASKDQSGISPLGDSTQWQKASAEATSNIGRPASLIPIADELADTTTAMEYLDFLGSLGIDIGPDKDPFMGEASDTLWNLAAFSPGNMGNQTL